MKKLFVFLVVVASCGTQTEKDPFAGPFKRQGLDKKYAMKASLQPPVLIADFNGDRHADRASWVVEKQTGKMGILLQHGNSEEFFVFGAGTAFGEPNDDDYQWADQWRVYTDAVAFETQFDPETFDIVGGKDVALRHPALEIMAVEDGAPIAGGIIYWNGKTYSWIHQGE